jgi:hypothetical protein
MAATAIFGLNSCSDDATQPTAPTNATGATVFVFSPVVGLTTH